MINALHKLPKEIIQTISGEQAYHYKIVPVEVGPNSLKFNCLQPTDSLKQELEIILGKQIVLVETANEQLNLLLAANYRENNNKSKDSLNYSEDFLENLLLTAQNIGSSDIHFEIYENKCRVRLRLDGKLIEHYVIAKTDYPKLINKLKIKAGLDISEKRLPQDGRISVLLKNNEFDVRVSSLPTLYGEKMVLRILQRDTQHISLTDLGLTKEELSIYKETIKKPNGIILISGPTGSGKTTTLYATLKLLNNETTNILTIEDPIEYILEGINQVQLKESIGLDFTSTLRTFLRQDPDVIMVGEIRDANTANMAIRAALTGHLVLSTIHTNSAWATISRLIDMGIPPFLIASTLNASIAQRLVRKLCPHCKIKTNIDKNEFPENFEIPKSLQNVFKPVGCQKCHYTGYNGRQAIYEILPITNNLSELIMGNQLEIDGYVQINRISTLKNNAIKLVENGTTSIEEVYPILLT
ncbi:type II/IV secretion system protein [Paucihalobacter ruber]|uniref:Type II/IV secretion system protein n=1 Tax=Paucihalobacter ruber TaxID=2567861 RepID=A0A506PML2_9FLAO|nr:GspE/PulE family protein [Paucihalobacter ruber]TPV35103.1 type II/IV secretion system protein [Paucihalobacter ruber]